MRRASSPRRGRRRVGPGRGCSRSRWSIPFFFGPYRVSQFTLVIIYAIAVLGLNLLVGYSGQISLGHGAFFASAPTPARSCSTAPRSRTC